MSLPAVFKRHEAKSHSLGSMPADALRYPIIPDMVKLFGMLQRL